MSVLLLDRNVCILTFRWFSRILVRECHSQLEQTSVPDCVGLARNSYIPLLQICKTVGASAWLCEETKWMVLAPLLSLLL